MTWIRQAVAKRLPHDTHVCTCPPGKLGRGAGPPIFVRSMTRSGTHILIDLVLNNFPELKRRPLYLDIDRYIEGGHDSQALDHYGSGLVKGHYPQGWQSDEADSIVQKLAARSIVLEPVRNLDSLRASLERFWPEKAGDELDRGLERYQSFWSARETHQFQYERLIDPSELESVLDELDVLLPYERRARAVGVRRKDATSAVMVDKLLTRTLGARAPRINTTIHFAK